MEHVDCLVLDGLEAGDGPTELHALLGVVDAELKGALADADGLGAQHHCGIVGNALPQRRLVPGRADARGRSLGELEPGHLAGDVEGGDHVGARLLHDERAQTVVGAGGDDRPVRRVPVDDRWLEAVKHPATAAR